MGRLKKFWEKTKRVPLTPKIFFIQNLQVMIRAGLSLSQSLGALAEQTTNKKLKKIIIFCNEGVAKGETLSSLLANFPEVFPEIFVKMIEAGEMSGNLEKILEQLALQLKKDYEIISKVKGALTYPIVVVCAMLVIGVAMIMFVIPKLLAIFTEANAKLPLPTRILIALSDFATQHGIIFILLIVGVITGFFYFIKSKFGKPLWHNFLLKTPIIGPVIKQVNLARFSRTLESLIKTDIPVVQSFQITANVLGNLTYKKIVLEAADQLKKGAPIAEILKKHPRLFPPMVTQMVFVGEESGNLDELLGELAIFYEENVRQTMNNFSSIIEPILILVLGLAVGFMAIAIVMPMYSLTEQI